MKGTISNSVIKRAEKILKSLEEDVPKSSHPAIIQESQLSLQPLENDEIIDELKRIDVTVLTPLEDMNVLYKLSEKAKEAEIK